MAVAAGLANGLCVGMVLLARQPAPRAVALAYADPAYIDWLDSAGLASTGRGTDADKPRRVTSSCRSGCTTRRRDAAGRPADAAASPPSDTR